MRLGLSRAKISWVEALPNTGVLNRYRSNAIEVEELVSFDEQIIKDSSVAGKRLQRSNNKKPKRQGKSVL